MKGKRARVLLLTSAVATLGCLVWLIQSPSEPSYRRRPLSQWLDDNYQSHLAGPYRPIEEGTQERAEAAIRHIGTNALPTLLKMASYKTSTSRALLLSLATKVPLWKAVPGLYGEDDFHLSAYTAFRVLGPTAQPAVPALAGLLQSKNTNVQDYAAAILDVITNETTADTAKNETNR